MRRRGFTLLEVMVAIAILGLGLTAILSAQAGSFTMSSHARNISVATSLVRCKMTEVEEHLLRDGYQELAENETGPCCEGDETPNMHCTWKVEKPELPEPKLGELDLDTDLDSLGALGKLAGAEDGNPVVSADAGIAGLAETLSGSGDPAGGAAQAAAGLTTMVMNMVYPDLKALFEASTRKITVTATWSEGINEHSIEIAQWVTSPQQAGLTAGTEDEELIDESDTGSSSGSKSSSSGSRSSGSGSSKSGSSMSPKPKSPLPGGRR